MIEWLGKIAIKHRIITNDVNITLIFFISLPWATISLECWGGGIV